MGQKEITLTEYLCNKLNLKNPYEKINFNKPVTRKDVNQKLYTAKLKFADAVLKSKNPSPFAYKLLLNDYTTYTYMFQRKDGKPIILYDYQDLFLNDNHRFKIFRASNQIGKTFSFIVKAIKNLQTDFGHGHNEAIVSKSMPQSLFQMRQIKQILNNMPTINWKEEKGDTDNMQIISCSIKDENTGEEKYKNYLIVAPATEGLLGYPLHELNLDEFEFWDTDIKYFFNQIAQPRTYMTKGKITIISNPNGMSFVSELEDQFAKGTRRKKWHTYVFNFLDCPSNTETEYKQLKAELPRFQFESTVAAIRSTSDKNFFTSDEIEASCDKKLSQTDMLGKQPFFFLDVGYKHDRSCLIGGFIKEDEGNPNFIHIYIPIIHLYPEAYPLSRVAGTSVDENDGWHYEKSVREYLEEWKSTGINPVFGFDVTGNKGMKVLFESMGIIAEDIVFSGPSKSEYYTRFKYYMEKGLLHRIPHDEWEEQARKLTVTRSIRGYLLVNSGQSGGRNINNQILRETAKMKKIPDDCMDATAGLIQLCDNHGFVPPSFKII